nr:uncharacterized protein LOC132765521 [Anolis sagrei ordinatus]
MEVLLGKVKKIPPAKGKKKIALDPAPNFDCHMSTVHPSVKDLLENQALGSLVYLYEYNELAKPVDRPRQCLPYAVVKLKCVNLRKCAGFTLTSLKGRPKGLPKRVERDLPLENCTRVTRIGKSQLIYEHFRKPIESCTPEMDASIDIRNCHIDKEKLLEIHKGVSPDSGLSIVTTSKSIKDPRLARRQQILEKQNGEAASHESLTYEKKLDCNLEMQMSAALGIPYILPATSLLFDSSLVSGQRQCMEKTTWKECTPEECLPSPLLNHEQWLGNIEKEILGWQNTYTSLALETYLDNHYFKSIDSQHSVTVMGGNLQEQKEMQYSELFSSQLNPYQTVGNVWIPQDSHPSSKEHECIIEPFFNYYDNDQYMYRKNRENITSRNDETDGREEVRSWLCDGNEDNDDDNYTSEKHCSAALDAKYFMNSCTLSEGEHSIKFCNLQDNTLQSGKIPFSENALRDVCTEDQYIFERSVVEMSTEYLEQNELEAVKQSEKSGILEVHNKIEQIDSVSETTKPTVAEKKEHIVKELKENSVEERIDNTDFTGFSNANPEMFDTGIFGRENIPEICEQALEIKYRDVQDFKIICEMDDALKGHKKCLSGPLKLCDHKNLADEEGIYVYLQKRMDWDSANTEVPGNPSGNENVNEHLPREKPVLEDMETDSFNTFVYPDLEISVTTLFQSESKKEVGKRASKYSGLKKSIKSLQGKTLEKCTEVQKNCKPCHTKEECSSATFSSLSKGQFKKTVQSEKRIKNTFNTHNREVLLCKNRRLSKKIGGALFHLRKARRRVQSLKIGAKTRKKKSNISLSHINKMVHNGSLPSGSFAASDCLSDMPCRSDSVTNTAIREAEVVSDTPTPNKASSNSLSNESTLSDEQNSVNFTSSNIVEDTNQNLSFENNLSATQNTANHLNLSVIGNELVSHVDKNKVEVISNRNMDIVSLATTSHTALESSAKEDVFKPGDTSKLSPNFLMLENVGDEKRIMEMCPVEENEYTSIIAERYFLLPAKQKHDAGQVQLTPQIHDVGLVHLNTRSNDSSNKILEKSSERLVVESFTGQEQEANFHMENMFLKPEDSCPSELSRKAEWEFCAAEYNRCRKSDIMTKSVNQPENNFEVVCPSGYLESPVSLEDNKLSHSSSNYAFQGCEDVGIAFLETKEHFSDPKQCVINDILVKPLMNMSLDQKHLPHTTYSTSCQETTCGQPSTSLLARTFSEEHVESITATSPSASAYYDVITTKTKQMFTSSMTRPNENYISVGLPNSNTDLGSDYTYLAKSR